MWRIYTSRENFSLLSKLLFKEGIPGFYFDETDVYLPDAGYRCVLHYVKTHEDFGEFLSERLSFVELKAIFDNL